MNRSEQINELATALAKAQGEMKNPGFDSSNPHFKSKFASLASVRNAVVPILSKHGIALQQDIHATDRGIACTTVLMHSSGQWAEYGPLEMPASKGDAQGFGSASTYARRYHLQAVAGVVGDEDDDGNAASVKKPTAASKAVTVDAFESLPEATQKKLADAAADVLSYFEEGKEATGFEAYVSYRAEMDADTQAGFWSLFPSNVRSAIKKMGQQQKEVA